MILLDALQEQFNQRVHAELRRPKVWQLYLPMYHEDGDMVDVYVRELDNGLLRVSDGAMSLMRLSYTFNVHTPARERILQRILNENGVRLEQGEIYYDTPADELYPAVMLIVQVQLKVNNMELFQRETIQDLFYELLDEFVNEKLGDYAPQREYMPLTGRDDLEVDYRLRVGERDLFLYGIRDASKARLATICTLEFQLNGLPHRSVAVHRDFDGLPRKDRSRTTNVFDKQFTGLDDFREHGERYLQREAA